MANRTPRTSQKRSTPHSIGRLMDADLFMLKFFSPWPSTRNHSGVFRASPPNPLERLSVGVGAQQSDQPTRL
jgi:hypothetical protein